MKKLIVIILAWLPVFSVAQRSHPIVSNDSVFAYNPSTKEFEFVFKTSAVQGLTVLDVYPVGSIYISVSSTNPGSIFGGAWVAFATGRTLIGVDAGQTEFDTVQETGGAKTKTLTESELPAHTHNIPDVRSATTGAASTRIARSVDASSTAGSDVETAATGSGSAFSILNPYVTVYFWRRTL